ncbi:MAG: YggS family pyridoxal phosphate-dependent enzyme [Nitrospirae bacterium]|nr:MAG: YggS family pyridoxal phosphate-dependent enzyme [Nitrospirota bacterium]
MARNVRAVFDNIRQAALRTGRRPEAVRLIAATKTVAPDLVRSAIEAGVHLLGESRLQEALPKIEAVGDCQGIAWHFIGRLQRRKVKAVVGRFQMIHSVDSLDLAAEINRRAAEAGLVQAVLMEVNIGEEATKGGLAPAAVAEAVAAIKDLPNLSVQGLMAVPPLATDPEAARPYFRRLRELVLSLPYEDVKELSMGMSQDYAVAVEEGATMVRVGTAIFGARRG